MSLNALAIESHYGGSHKAFLDSWIAQSQHQWKVLSLPAANWKSRIRHSAYHFAAAIDRLEQSFDILFCSDLINLAELKALSGSKLANIPIVLYFHENQFSYPVQPPNQINRHLAFHNLTSAAVADMIWWNSFFNKKQFLAAVQDYTQRFQDYDFSSYLEDVESKSIVFSPGVDLVAPARTKNKVPVICWAARWENDKAPQTFFKAMRILAEGGFNFKINVMGEQGDYTPDCFASAQANLKSHIQRWGYQPSRGEYLSGLAESDFFVSTAIHEFFGMSVVEAILCGAYPVLPQRLAYPEVMQLNKYPERSEHFYQGGAPALARHFSQLLQRYNQGSLWKSSQEDLLSSFEKYRMSTCSIAMDQQLIDLAGNEKKQSQQAGHR